MPLSKIPGLVLHLPMNEKNGVVANDNSRCGNDGSLGGGDADKMPVWVEHGLRFDGTDDYVDCGNDSSLDTPDAITVSTWLKKGADGIKYRMISKGDANPFQIGFETNNKLRFVTNIGGVTKNVYSDSAITGFEWYHVVGIYDGSEHVVYVDGVKNTHINQAGAINTNNTPIYIGTNTAFADEFNGSIDQVRIYNRALSAAEITDLYNERRHLYV